MQPIHFVYLCPAVAILALLYAYIKAAWVKKQDEGTDRMKLIGGWIADGAMAFLGREYKVLVIFVIAVAILLGVSNQMLGPEQNTNGLIALSFILGAFCSGFAGYFGMKTATKANIRTASAARKGLNEALQVAFAGGSVMGLSVVGLALTGMGALIGSLTIASIYFTGTDHETGQDLHPDQKENALHRGAHPRSAGFRRGNHHGDGPLYHEQRR